VPWYLARHYWWAYLWRKGIWFFDHQPVINAILFGQYRRLMQQTLSRYRPKAGERTLQLTCVYGELTPHLCERSPDALHLMDVCMDQLHLARRKCRRPIHAARMNAESLGYRDDCFDHVILFFLLHEMPPEARRNTLNEMLRVTRAGGSILITEYAERPSRHPLYRFAPSRWLLGRLEPFLPGFWDEDLDARLKEAAARCGKALTRTAESRVFAGFYRILEYRVEMGQADVAQG